MASSFHPLISFSTAPCDIRIYRTSFTLRSALPFPMLQNCFALPVVGNWPCPVIFCATVRAYNPNCKAILEAIEDASLKI